MLITPMDVVTQFPVRKTRGQKQAFRDAVQSYVESLGYQCQVETGKLGVNNMVIGDPDRAKYLVTAHYDTGVWFPVPDYVMPFDPVLATVYQLVVMIGYVLTVGLASSLALLCVCLFTGDPILEALAYLLVLSPLLGIFVGFLLIPIPAMLFTAKKHNANCNTSGVVTLLEILRTLPDNQRHKVCFVLFDLNEAGLMGSAFYKKAHRASITNQIVLNLSCVGDGDHMLMIPTGKVKKDQAKYKPLFKCCGYFGKKSLLVQNKGNVLLPSDYIRFPYAVQISAFRKGKLGRLYSAIHTPKDTILDQTNVNILRAAITTLISSDAAQ